MGIVDNLALQRSFVIVVFANSATLLELTQMTSSISEVYLLTQTRAF